MSKILGKINKNIRIKRNNRVKHKEWIESIVDDLAI